MEDIRKESDFGWGTDAYPAQQPQELQFQFDRQQMSDMSGATKQVFRWVLAGKTILVVSPDNLDDAYRALGIVDDHHGPFATGSVEITHRWTTSFVVEKANVDLDFLHGIFRRWAKDPSTNFKEWNHPLHLVSVQDKNGIPLPVGIRKMAADPGIGDDHFKYPWKNTDKSLLTDIQIQDNDRGKLPGQGDLRVITPRLSEDTYGCTECSEVFDSYSEFLLHMTHDHPKKEPTGPEYEIRDNDEYFYPDNEASRPGGGPGGQVVGAAQPAGPIPFSFHVERDRLYVGEPGDERVEIDETNPFGVAEGYYTPDGDLLIVNQSSLPYTIRHLINLWIDMYPEHEVKHVYVIHQQDDKKIKERVANA
jgi:hypothetical protein